MVGPTRSVKVGGRSAMELLSEWKGRKFCALPSQLWSRADVTQPEEATIMINYVWSQQPFLKQWFLLNDTVVITLTVKKCCL